MESERKASSNRVAIFPLPGMVAFEGQQHLLHIFEPRYRKMVEDCLKLGLPLGLALPRKMISNVDNEGRTFQEVLNSNQNTYEAHEILGAGFIRILKTLPDGRQLILVSVTRRLKVESVIQSIPYYLAQVEFQDSLVDDMVLASQCFCDLLSVSRNILGDKFPLFEEKIPEGVLRNQDLQELILKIMDWFRLDSGMLQDLLDEQIIEKRALKFLDYMKIYLRYETASHPIPSSKVEGKIEQGKVIKVDFKKTLSRSRNHNDFE